LFDLASLAGQVPRVSSDPRPCNALTARYRAPPAPSSANIYHIAASKARMKLHLLTAQSNESILYSLKTVLGDRL